MAKGKAAFKLLPPLKSGEIFKRTKGRVAKIKPGKGGGGRALGRTLTAREKAAGIAHGKTEVMIKFDRASGGIRSAGHMMAALEYESRNGKMELTNEGGEMVAYPEARCTVEEWCRDMDVPETAEDSRRPADARRCIVSCPAGTDPQKFKAAVSEWGQEMFGQQGYHYMLAVHYRDAQHPKEPEHPHAHFLIKAVNDEGRRLNIRKADLRYMRERFAVIAKEHGIEMNATSRAVRGQTARAKTQAQIHQERRRQEQSQAQKWAIDRRKKQLAKNKKNTQLHPYEKARREELKAALLSGKDLPDHPVLRKAKKTREQVKQNAEAYIKELRTSGSAEDKQLADALEKKYAKLPQVESVQQQKLRIARRIAAERRQAERAAQGMEAKQQSQAQKWAIDRKKKQQGKMHER